MALSHNRSSRVTFNDSGSESGQNDHIHIDDESDGESYEDVMSVSTHPSVEMIHSSNNGAYRILKNYLSRSNITERSPGSRRITLLDTGSFYLEPLHVVQFFNLLEKCINSKPQISEQQTDETGLMMDFDIMQTERQRYITDDLIESIIKIVIKKINMMFIQHSTTLRSVHGTQYLIAITRKPEPRVKNGAFKDGFHILIPSLIFNHAQRIVLIDAIAKDDAFRRLWDKFPLYWGESCKRYMTDNRTIVKLDMIDSQADKAVRDLYIREELVDSNSSHVPVFFVGCPTKSGTKPYKLHQTFNCELDSNEFKACDPPKKLIRALSINFAPERIILKTREAFTSIVDDVHSGLRSSRHQDNLVARIRAISDPAADQVFNCIGLLKKPSGSNCNIVNTYLAILAKRGPQWEPMGRYLANHFKEYDELAWPQRWTKALNTPTDRGINTIFSHAKKCNPEAFSNFVSLSKNRKFHEQIISDQCKLKNYTAAMILKIMHDDMLKFAILNGQPLMFQMITDSMPEAASSAGPWKWHSMSTALMQILMGKTSRMSIIRVFRGMVEKYGSLIQASSDQSSIESLKERVKILTQSMQSVKDAGFLPASLRMLSEELYDSSFNERLDRHDSIIGTKDGVLRLGPKYMIVKEMHNYSISRSTSCNVIPYVAGDEICETILRSFRELFPKTHTDMFNYFMNMTGAAMGNGSKPQKFNHLRGLSTGNGKSAWGDMACSALGFQYSCVMPSEQLSPKNSTGSEAASPALIKQSIANLLLHDEQTPGDILTSRMVKMITGGDKFTGRALFSNIVEQFNFHCILALTSNGDLSWDNSVGIHRRFSVTDFLIRFRVRSAVGSAVITDEYEVEANTDIVAKWPRDPEYIGRFAGIMAEFNSQLHRHWDGDYTKTTSKHTDAAIKAYCDQLTSLRRFINSCCVRCIDAAGLKNSDEEFVSSVKDTLTDIENSSSNNESKNALFDLMQNVGEKMFDMCNRANQRKECVPAMYDDNEPNETDCDSTSMTAAYNAYERWHRRNGEQDRRLERGDFDREIRQHQDLGRFYSNAKGEGDIREKVIFGHLFDPELGTYSGGARVPMRSLNISRIDDSQFISMTPSEYVEKFNYAIVKRERFPTGLRDDDCPVYNGPMDPLKDSFDTQHISIKMPTSQQYRDLAGDDLDSEPEDSDFDYDDE